MTEIYQISHLDKKLTLGRDDTEIVSFRPCRRLRAHWLRGVLLEATFEDALYELMLPAPWNGSKWRLTEHGHDLATAENVRNTLGPVKIKSPASFDVSYRGRALRLTTINPDKTGYGHHFELSEGGGVCGGLEPRAFDHDTPWHFDLEIPDGLPVPVAAFLAWLAKEGGKEVRRMGDR